MTTEERVMLSLNHQEPDRVPIWELINDRKLYNYFAPNETGFLHKVAKTYKALGIDVIQYFLNPFEEAEKSEEIITDNDGNPIGKYSGGTRWVVKHAVNSLKELKSWRPRILRYEDIVDEYVATFKKEKEIMGPETLVVRQDAPTILSYYPDLLGMDLFSTAIYNAREELKCITDILMENARTITRIYADYKLGPMFMICEDLGYKGTTLFSPQFIREFYIPRLKKAMEPLKEANIKVIFHSDGGIMAIVDDLVKAGIDGLNPLQPDAGMNIKNIKEKHGDKLIIVGNVDTQVLTFGTPEEVKEAVKDCIKIAGPDGGFFLGTGAGEIDEPVPLKNSFAYFKAAKEYGQYPINL